MMAGVCCAVEKEIKDSLTRQGTQKIRGLHRKVALRGKRKKYFFLREHTNNLCTVKTSCLISEKGHAPHFAQQHNLKSAGQGGHFHCTRLGIPPREMCVQARTAHIPDNMLRELRMQIARWHQVGNSSPQTSA